MPVAALRLVFEQGETARRELARLLIDREHRADLWSWRGTACTLAERPDEACASYARALLLDASLADLFRLREPRLRALLFAHAWLRGLLDVPPENGWLDLQVARLRAETAVRDGAPLHARARRFSFLLYLDRSRRPGEVDLGEREEMAALEPELSRRVVAVLREREGRSR